MYWTDKKSHPGSKSARGESVVAESISGIDLKASWLAETAVMVSFEVGEDLHMLNNFS